MPLSSKGIETVMTPASCGILLVYPDRRRWRCVRPGDAHEQAPMTQSGPFGTLTDFINPL